MDLVSIWEWNQDKRDELCPWDGAPLFFFFFFFTFAGRNDHCACLFCSVDTRPTFDSRLQRAQVGIRVFPALYLTRTLFRFVGNLGYQPDASYCTRRQHNCSAPES